MSYHASANPVSPSIEERADAFGRELAAALVLAGDRAGRDRAMMRAMTAVAGSEMRRAIEHFHANEIPAVMVERFERACRSGFQAELHSALANWQDAGSAQAA